MLIVTDSEHVDAPAIGVLTSEDILEEILQEELVGDDDEHVDQAEVSKCRPGLARQNSKRYDPTALITAMENGLVRKGAQLPDRRNCVNASVVPTNSQLPPLKSNRESGPFSGSLAAVVQPDENLPEA